MDFGLLPPEINSGRMYTGPGPGPMLAAAAAWDGLAAELHSMAATYESSVAELSAEWHGPSSTAMAAAATPYAAWVNTTAARAEQAAAQGRAAAAAYETAFAATVPPPMIAANRSLLMTLVATNILGQNTLAIAATEAHYAEMWAQDAAAMYCYAGSAATAATLAPFTQPPQTANLAGTAHQSAAVARAGAAGPNILTQLTELITSAPGALQSLATVVTPGSVAAGVESGTSSASTLLANLTGAYSPIGMLGIPGGWWLTAMQVLGTAQNVPGVTSLLNGPAPITGALGPLSGGYVSWQAPMPGGGAASAAMGRSILVGSLAVPTSWASTVPSVKTVATVLPSTALSVAPTLAAAETPAGLLGGQMALSSLAGRAIGGGAAHSIGAAATRTIGARAGWAVGAEAVEDSGNEVTIIVIPPAGQ